MPSKAPALGYIDLQHYYSVTPQYKFLSAFYNDHSRRVAPSTGAMDLIPHGAGRLKPEVRLGRAVAEFEACLSKEQRAAFTAGKIDARASPPNLRSVMQLTAQIDIQSRTSGRRCFGPRMTKLLESVQQFASMGDVIVGGSQNIISCGVYHIRIFLFRSLSGNRLLRGSLRISRVSHPY